MFLFQFDIVNCSKITIFISIVQDLEYPLAEWLTGSFDLLQEDYDFDSENFDLVSFDSTSEFDRASFNSDYDFDVY